MKQGIRRMVAGSRFVILRAVIGAFAASLVALAYGLIVVFIAIRDIIRDGLYSVGTVKVIASNLVSMIDRLLLGTVLYIITLGLYKLFIDEGIEVPSWLDFNDLDEVKTRLLTVVVVLISVEFLASVVEWNGKDILRFGVAIGVVLLAIAAFMWVIGRGGSSGKRELSEPDEG